MQCVRCGKCCRTMILEPDEIDVEREPRLLEYAEKLKQPDIVDASYRWNNQYLLPSPCPFLRRTSEDGRYCCIIHPTRPNMCVVFEAGIDEHCKYTPIVVASGE